MKEELLGVLRPEAIEWRAPMNMSLFLHLLTFPPAATALPFFYVAGALLLDSFTGTIFVAKAEAGETVEPCRSFTLW